MEQRLRTVIATAVAALVLVGWFVWPLSAALQEPLRGAFAAGRAVLLFLVVLGATNTATAPWSFSRSRLARCAVGFVIALAIVGGISAGLALTASPEDPPGGFRPLAWAAGADAAWCALALAVYDGLAPSRPALRRS